MESDFEKEINKRNIKPTRFLKIWDLLGVGLGFGSTLLGKKAAMLCTASVEEVIDEHYKNQIDQIEVDEKELKAHLSKSIATFKIPRQILILNEIPKGNTGKIQRIGLAKKLGLEQ